MMRKLSSILFTSALLFVSSCTTQKKSFESLETNVGVKDLVNSGSQVIANARKYNLPLYVLKKDGKVVSFYTEGIVTEEREKFGKVEFGYECTDNLFLFDDKVSNGIRVLNPRYSVERQN